LQGESAGAQAFANFDTYLAPFIRYDKLTYEDVRQSMQEFLFNMNIPTRVGFQTPFTNVTLDLLVPSNIADEYIVIGGEFRTEKYGEFQEEMDMFNAAFSECLLQGDALNRIFTFPIPTYNISKDFDWDNPKHIKIWEMTAKYGIPYFANFVNSDMKPEDARSMCCRLRLDNRELRSRGGGLFGANPLTGSIGVVTINMPRLAYKSADEDNFFERLNYLMDAAKESLEIKRKVLENFTRQNLYPYTRHYLREIYERNGKYWVNHFSTIGLVGMNEACQNLIDCTIDSPEGKEFVVRVLDYMRDRIISYQEETGNLYNLEATPAEGVSYRFARNDKNEFNDIITAGKGEPYYTNSVHLPVNHTDDIFEVLDHQDDLQVKFTGGTVVHCFIGEQIDDPNMAKTLVRRIAENYRLPYFTLTPTFSICPVHGYIPGSYTYCPYDHSDADLDAYGIDVKESDSAENRRVVQI
jgi:ribonucleoside-triphosphate reductase (formate)